MITGIALALAAAALWSASMTAAKPSVCHVDRITFILGRWFVALVFLVVLGVLRRSLSFPTWQVVGWCALSSVLDAVVGWVVFLMVLERFPAHHVITLTSTAPLWGVIGSLLFLGEPARWSVLVAALMVVLGSLALSRGRRTGGGRPSSLISIGLGLLTGMLWGVAETVPLKLALQAGATPTTTMTIYALTAVVGLLTVAPFLRRRIPRRVTRQGIVFIVLSAGFGAVSGWLLWIRALEMAPVSVLAPIRGATLLFAFFYSVAFLRERPHRFAWFGACLVLSGILLVSLV